MNISFKIGKLQIVNFFIKIEIKSKLKVNRSFGIIVFFYLLFFRFY